MKKKNSPDLKTWKEFRYNLLSEDTEFSRHKHGGDFIGTRDVYDYLQEHGLFNKDFKIELHDVEEREREPLKIVGFKMDGLKLIIEVI